MVFAVASLIVLGAGTSGEGEERIREDEENWGRRECGGRLWKAREQGGHTGPGRSLKYPRCPNGQIRNQQLFPNGPRNRTAKGAPQTVTLFYRCL